MTRGDAEKMEVSVSDGRREKVFLEGRTITEEVIEY
jgi:hypothetical protein